MTSQLRLSLAAGLAAFLGSLALLPLFTTLRWLGPVAVVIAAVTVASLLFRQIRPIAGLAPLAGVAGYVFAVTALFAHTSAVFGFLPGPGAVASLRDTLVNGFTDTTEMSAPVTPTRGITLLAAGGVGLVAVMIDISVTALRRPAICGLPLLAVFTVPAAILNQGVGWLPFVCAAAGYLLLLTAEGRERLSGWGRAVVGRVAGGRRWPATVGRELARSGHTMAAVAILIAIAVPLAIPGLHAGWFGTHHTSGGGVDPGGGGATIQPFVSIRRDLTQSTPIPLFTYTTSGRPDYFRMLTLDEFDGTTWRASGLASGGDIAADTPLPAVGGTTETRVVTQVTVSGLREPFLPVPQVPLRVDVGEPWKFNPTTGVFYDPQGVTRKNQHYTVVSAPITPSVQMLRNIRTAVDPTATRYLQYPTNIPPNIKQLADQIVARAGTPYEKALALQNWFLANFTYDINARSGSSTSALESFLQDRTGYCEQFAATMALMARMEGIPARVDIGFTPGEPVTGTDSYVVTTADAHAWPELYFPGIGWLRFEPTPRADGQATVPAYGATGTVPSATVPPTPSATGPGTANIPSAAPSGAGVAAPGTRSVQHGVQLPRIPPELLGLIVLVALGVGAGPAARWWIRERRWTAADDAAAEAHVAWAELGDDVRDLRLEWTGDTDTPRRAAQRLAAAPQLRGQPEATDALFRLAHAEELARYATPHRVRNLAENFEPRRDQQLVRRALIAAMPRSRRLRALLLPTSVRTVLRSRRRTSR